MTYTDPSLRDRMTIDDDYSLTLMGLSVVDTANYTCTAFMLNATVAQMENLSTTLELIVQGQWEFEPMLKSLPLSNDNNNIDENCDCHSNPQRSSGSALPH